MSRSGVLTWDRVDELLPQPVTAHDVDTFLRRPEVVHMISVAVTAACHRWSIDLRTHGEDFTNEARTLVFLMLTDPASSASARRIVNGLGAAVYLRFGDRVKSIVESPAWLGSAGLSSRVRRARALAVFTDRLAHELGRVPSPQEVVDRFNAAVTSTRADAARQGMIASVQDLVEVTPDKLDPVLSDVALSHDDDTPLVGVEARLALSAALRRCAAESSEVALVAAAWLGHFDDDPPYIATVAEIVAETGMPAALVRLHRERVQEVMREVLAQEFGVTEDDV